MSETSIEWTARHNPDGSVTPGKTWNPIRARNLQTGGVGHFCVHHSPGCLNCYAERMQPRFQNPIRYNVGDQQAVEIFLDPVKMAEPLRWQQPRMIFVCSMTDLFGAWVDNEWIAAVFGVMAACPNHIFQLLTKRPDRALEWFRWVRRTAEGHETTPAQVCRHHAQRLCQHPKLRDGKHWDAWEWPPRNGWFGVSAENQRWADERIPILLEIPAAIRYVSLEPLLGPIQDGTGWHWNGADWLIVGGESGPGARACDVAWIREIVRAGTAAGCAVFTKQLGSHAVSATKSDHKGRTAAGSPLGSAPEAPAPWRLWLSDAKGGGSDMTEWPDDLRVRQHPHRHGNDPSQPAPPSEPGPAAARH